MLPQLPQDEQGVRMLYGGVLSLLDVPPKTFTELVDKVGLHFGNGKNRRKHGPFEDAKIPVGPFLRVVVADKKLFAAFKPLTLGKHNKRGAVLHDYGAVGFLIKAAAVELIRTPGDPVLSRNMEHLAEALGHLEHARSNGKMPVPQLRDAFPLKFGA